MKVMIKGCQKKMVLVKCAGSELFEEAFFILKSVPSSEKAGRNDMTEEAGRIISNSINGISESLYTESNVRFRRKLTLLISFAVGIILGGSLAALLFFICGIIK